MAQAVTQIAVGEIRPSPNNPRVFHDADPALAGLSASIRELGVLQPILVRPVQGVNGDGALYELIAGERRWRAARVAGLEAVPALIREDLTDREALALTVTENLQREDLHPLEEARGVAALVESGDDYRAVADRLGKSLGWVARRARLAHLAPDWVEGAADPEGPFHSWTGAHLELVARLEPAVQVEVLDQLDRQYDTETMRVGELQRWLADYTRELKRFPWDLEDETLVPSAGACAACPKRSSCHPGLFDEEVDGEMAADDRCLDAHCYESKMAAHLERKASAIKEKYGGVAYVGDAWNQQTAPEFARGKVESEWNLKQTKKTTKGAVPVLVVSGPKAGTTYFAVRERDTRAGGKKVAAEGPPPTAAEQLEQRQRKLDGRRKARAIEAFREDLVSGAIPMPSAEVARCLAACFGTSHRLDIPGYHGYVSEGVARALGVKDPYVDPWASFDALEATGKDAEVLFAGVAEVLCGRLVFHDVEGAIKRWSELERIAAIVERDPQEYLDQAIEALPEPKAWAKLRAAVEAEAAA